MSIGGPVASGVGDKIYGSYYHQHLAVHVDDLDHVALGDPGELSAFIRQNPDPQLQIDRALRDVVFLHEVRHFHDCFGTLAGIELFELHISRLRAFAQLCSLLRKDGVLLELPFDGWADSGRCPDYVRSFVARLRYSLVLEKAFTGHVLVPSEQTTTEKLWRDIEVWPGLRIPAVPVPIAVSLGTNQGLSPPTLLGTHWAPIGFEQLIEGNAQSLQRDYIEAHWPKHVADLLLRRQLSLEGTPDGIGNELKSLVLLPYHVTDATLTGYLKKTHNINSFPPDRLTELADYALMRAFLPQHGTAGAFMSAGGAFIAAMIDSAVWSGDLTEPVCRNEPDIVQLLRDSVRQLEPPDPREADATYFGAINYVHRYAWHHIIAPILDLRLRLGNDVMWAREKYWRHFPEFPVPPVVMSATELARSRSHDPDFLERWLKFVVFSHVAQQIWSGEKIIHCPRAYGSIPGIEKFELFPSAGCRLEIRKRTRCLTWSPGKVLPGCYFRTTINAVRLI